MRIAGVTCILLEIQTCPAARLTWAGRKSLLSLALHTLQTSAFCYKPHSWFLVPVLPNILWYLHVFCKHAPHTCPPASRALLGPVFAVRGHLSLQLCLCTQLLVTKIEQLTLMSANRNRFTTSAPPSAPHAGGQTIPGWPQVTSSHSDSCPGKLSLLNECAPLPRGTPVLHRSAQG